MLRILSINLVSINTDTNSWANLFPQQINHSSSSIGTGHTIEVYILVQDIILTINVSVVYMGRYEVVFRGDYPLLGAF